MSQPHFSQHTLFLKLVSIITIIVSVLVTVGWLFEIPSLLSVIPGAATMKANTALCFLLLGIIGLVYHPESKQLIIKLVAGIVILISSITLFQYVTNQSIGIDTIIIEDTHSEIVKNRMSPATAICFLLISLGVMYLTPKHKANRLFVQYQWLLVMVIAFISIVTYILNIPAEEKTEMFSSMAIHTSALFFLVASGLFFQTSDTGFAALLTGPLPGSKITRRLLPFTIILPIALSYLFFFLSIHLRVDATSSFWVIINTITLTLLSVLYISVLAIGLNKSAKKQNQLQSNLILSNNTLSAFQQAIDATSMVLILNHNWQIIDANASFLDLAKYNTATIAGLNIESIVENQKELKDIQTSFKEKDFWEGEIECLKKNGETFWTHTAICTIPSNSMSNATTQLLVLQYDVSARKEIEQLRTSQFIKVLEQKKQELEQFGYTVSHDLQEPLKSMKSIITLLKLELSDQLTDSTEQLIEYIESSANRMTALIHGLLDYSRLGREKEFELTDLNILLKEVQLDLAERQREENATLKVNKLPQLEVYPLEIRLLFQNLISNAFKFKKPEEFPVVAITAKEETNFWRFEVKDNGIGIKSTDKGKIFEMFQRLHGRNEYEGSGIGLAHCKKIVSLHGGEIGVESQYGKGTTFFFKLPKKQFKISNK